ncbi:MAG: DMT family transporter [Alphaproteobacteria bacterium]|nr:MAG: DMT family transporter [Alphaproteobacteria bacterium]
MHQPIPQSAARAGRYAFPALVLANLMLAFGPWMVRLADVGPVASGFWRLALAAPVLLLVARRDLFGEGSGALKMLVAFGGLFFAADLAAWHIGIGMTKLANATLFGNSSSFLLVIYGFVVARALPARMQVAALVLAGAGAALLLGSSYEMSPDHFAGDLFAMLAGLFYTFYLVAVDRARKSMRPMPVLAIATAAGAVPLLLFALALGEKVVPTDWTPVILLAIGSQLIGQGLLVYAVGYLSPVVVGLGLLTQPAATALIGWFAYHERFGLADALGAVLIAAALVLIRLPERPGLATAADEDH